MPRDRDRSRDRDRERDRDKGRDRDKEVDTRDLSKRGREEKGSRLTGICKVWMEGRGMGFISPESGGQDFFVHRSQLLDGQSLAVGIEVTFDGSVDSMKNKPIAKNVKRTVQLAISVDANDPGAAHVPIEGTQTGTVSSWREDNGMGFITPDSGGGLDFFVHRSQLLDGGSLVVGGKVAYEPGWDKFKNKPVALRVSGAAAQISPKGGPTGPNAHLYAQDAAQALPQYQSWGQLLGGTQPAQATSSSEDLSRLAQQQIQQAIAQQQLSDLLAAGTAGSCDAATLAALASYGVLGALASPGLPPIMAPAEIAPTSSPALAAATAGLATGHVVEWAEERGMGFIRAIDGKGVQGDVFVHRSALQDTQSLIVGQTVMYEPGFDPKKNKACTKLCFVKSQPSGCPPPMDFGVGSASPALLDLFSVPPPLSIVLPTPSIVLPTPPPMNLVATSSAGSAFVLGQIVSWSAETSMGFIRSSDGGEVFVHRSALQDSDNVVEGTPCFYLPYWDPEKKKPCTKVCFVNGLPADGGAAALAQQAAEETEQALAVAVGDTGASNFLAEQFGGSSFVDKWPYVQLGPHASWKTLAGLSEGLSIR